MDDASSNATGGSNDVPFLTVLWHSQFILGAEQLAYGPESGEAWSSFCSNESESMLDGGWWRRVGRHSEQSGRTRLDDSHYHWHLARL